MVFARRRTTEIRPVLPWAPMRIAACAVALAVTAPNPVRPAAQDTAAARDTTSAWLAAYPPEPAFICGSPALAARQMLRGAGPNPISLSADPESPDGQPLWFDQQPRLIRADSEGLAFRDFLITGDIETLEFQRWSAASGESIAETWTRVTTRTHGGRLVSVFNPTWDEAELWDAIGPRRRGFDSPVVYFGTVRVPKGGDPDDRPDGDPDEDEDVEELHIRLPVEPLNLPLSRIRSLDADVQYASHVVNIVFPHFGDGRVDGNDYAFDFVAITRRFYDFFPDHYDSIAIVTAEQHPSSRFGAFHRNVRNPIAGLGMEEYDYSYLYGSLSMLRSVELYRDAQFATLWTSNHEIGHQWVDYWDWSAIAGGIERAGWSPSVHTPLLFPGEVLAGAALRPIRRVAREGSGERSEQASYVIERTPAPSLYHSTTLYRMGLIRAADVPEMVVFENQGQFSEDSAAAPPVGTVVEGEARQVHINDIMAQHGTRDGPVDASWRRATIVVSRDEPLSVEEMSYWNFFAARHEAQSGVTTFGGMPSFYEATGGRAPLHTGLTTLSGERVANRPPLQVSNVPIDPGEFRGVLLDEAIPGSMTAGTRLTFAGTLTSSAAADVVEICVEQVHIGGPPDDEGNDIRVVTACDEPAGNRFSMPLTFDQAGRYGLQVDLTIQPDGEAEPTEVSSSFMTGITVE